MFESKKAPTLKEKFIILFRNYGTLKQKTPATRNIVDDLRYKVKLLQDNSIENLYKIRLN